MAIIERSTRVRPGFRRLAIVAFVLLLPFALHAAWDYVEARRLARLVSELKAKNEPLAPAPATHVEMGEPRNAARFYDAAAALLVDTRGLYGPTGVIRGLEAQDAAARASALSRLRSWLQDNAEAESMLARATTQKFLGYPAGTNYGYRWDRVWMLANLAGLRAIERIAAGDGDGGLAAAVRQIRLVRTLDAIDGTSPIVGSFSYPMVSRSVVSAQAALRLHISDRTLADAQRAFREYDVDDALEQAVLQARARTLGTFWDAGRGWYSRTPGRTLSPPVWLVIRPLLAHTVVRQAREMTTWLEIARRRWPERLHTPTVREPQKPIKWWSVDYLARSNVAVMGQRFKDIGAGLAILRSLDAALAVERYRLAHDGQPPGSLAELVPSLLAAVPVDPYSGKPLRYRVTAARYVVYSVGPDEKDDGGNDIVWPKRAGSLYLTATPPKDVGIEGFRGTAAAR